MGEETLPHSRPMSFWPRKKAVGGFNQLEFIRARVERNVLVAAYRGLPSEVTIPNTETIEALRQARTGSGLNEYADLEAFKAEHG